MITEAIVSVFAAVAGFIVGLFPTWSPPAWLTTTVPDLIGQASDWIVGVNAWVPFDHVATVLGFVVLVLATAVAVRLVRIVASFLTAGGGSAG